MVKTTEGSLVLDDGTKLYTKSWEPDSTPKAILVALHGFSDHCNAYYDFFPNLASVYSIAVHSYDQRGWGRSVHAPNQKGLTGPTTTVLADVTSFIFSLISNGGPYAGKDIPIFLLGHSMGAQEALCLLLTEHPESTPYGKSVPSIKGLLLESPFVGMHPASQPHSITVWTGKLAAKVLPRFPLVQRIDKTYMCRDPKVQTDWANDPLCHDTGTLEGLASMIDRVADLEALADGKSVKGFTTKCPCPVWFGHGNADRVTNFESSKKLFEHLEVQDKTFREYPGAYHKLHVEPDGVKEDFEKDVGQWILAHAGATETSGNPVAVADVKAKL